MSSVRLGAALFNGDHGRLADEIARLEAAGLDFIHLDVFDGYFVSDMGFPPRTIASLRPLTKLPFEVHLGVIDPRRFIAPLAEAGADLILFHVESVQMLYEMIFIIREHQVKAGLAVTLGTPLAQLEPVIPLVDAILLLSRVTGEGVRGASFDPRALPRVADLHQMVQAAAATVDIQVAGSIKRQQVPHLVKAGATSLAMGSGIYKAPNMAHEVVQMRALAENLGDQ